MSNRLAVPFQHRTLTRGAYHEVRPVALHKLDMGMWGDRGVPLVLDKGPCNDRSIYCGWSMGELV